MDTSNRSTTLQALLLGAGVTGASFRELDRILAAEGLVLRQSTELAQAEQELAALAAAGMPALLVLVGPAVPNPLVAAHRLHRASPLSQIVLLADQARAEALRDAASPLAMLDDRWSVAHFGAADLASSLAQAARVARQRLQSGPAWERVEDRLASAPTSADEMDERAAPAAERLLTAILAHTYDAVIGATDAGTVTLWNPAAARLFGLSEAEALGRSILTVSGGGWSAALQAILAQAADARPAASRRELQCRRPDGSSFDAQLVVAPVLDDSGRRAGISAIVRDVTQSRRAEAALRESQRLLDAILDASTSVIYVKDLDGRYLLANRRFAELFGVTRESVAGKTDHDLFPTDVADAFRRLDRQVAGAGHPLSAEELAPHADGMHTYLSVKAPLFDADGRLYATCGISTDITERKRLEARFRATVESAPTAMVMTDAEGRIVLVNAEAEKLFGYARAELLGKPVEALVPGRMRGPHAGLRQGFQAAPEARRMGAGRDLFAVRRDGTEVPVEIGLNPIKTEDGNFVISAIVDITERRKLEEAMRDLNQELERRVELRTTELARSNEALERSNLELQQFAYIASHDLQSPLRAISGFVQLLQQDYGPSLGEEAIGWIDRVVANVQRMQTLIEDLLAYSRVESRAIPFQPVDMNEVFAHAVSGLESSIRDAGAQVTRDHLPVVVGDRSQLVQLLQNLIDNGIKYRRDAPPRVHVSAEQKREQWLLSVRDNGIGIAEKHLERIFELFHRLHTQQRYPGTGIGLAICRRVIHRHGGEIWADSRPGEGSTFHFTLPARLASDAAAVS